MAVASTIEFFMEASESNTLVDAYENTLFKFGNFYLLFSVII